MRWASRPLLWDASAILLFLSLMGLLRDNVTANELTKFTDAMVYADPGWVPGLFPQGPEPGRRQWVFQTLVAPLLAGQGFLTASIVGRLAGYAALAMGFAAVFRAVGLRLAWSIPVVFAVDFAPSMIAGEWLTTGIEPKVFSYALVLMALGPALRGEPMSARVGAALGAATSLHVLVGLYGALAIGGLHLARGRAAWTGWRHLLGVITVFAVCAAFALRPIIAHLIGVGDGAGHAEGLPASAIYVFLRAPHHLDPRSWPAAGWLRVAVFLLLLAAAWVALRRVADAAPARRLALFGACSMIPFFMGLLVASVDAKGRWLQYYPFRFGDVMLPFAVYLLGARFAQSLLPSPWVPRALAAALILAHLRPLAVDLGRLREFPGPAHGVTPEWRAVCEWARRSTPRKAIFVVPPLGANTFPWLARRRPLATFKQVNLSGGLPEWYRRMSALAAWEGEWPDGGWSAARWIDSRYTRLSADELRAVMGRYGASYAIRPASPRVELPVVFENESFIVYRFAPEATP